MPSILGRLGSASPPGYEDAGRNEDAPDHLERTEWLRKEHHGEHGGDERLQVRGEGRLRRPDPVD